MPDSISTVVFGISEVLLQQASSSDQDFGIWIFEALGQGLLFGAIAGLVTIPLLIVTGYGVLPPWEQQGKLSRRQQSESVIWYKHLVYSILLALVPVILFFPVIIGGIPVRAVLLFGPPLWVLSVVATYIRVGGSFREMPAIIAALAVLAGLLYGMTPIISFLSS